MTREQRFWAKVDQNGPMHPTLGTRCWLWVGHRNDRNYGIFLASPRRRVRAHRFAWELTNGALGNAKLCHHCDNPPCVNTEHHFKGTQAQNIADMDAKGRRGTKPKPEKCKHGHPFTPENTYRWRGNRECRTCNRRVSLQSYHRRNAA